MSGWSLQHHSPHCHTHHPGHQHHCHHAVADDNDDDDDADGDGEYHTDSVLEYHTLSFFFFDLCLKGTITKYLFALSPWPYAAKLGRRSRYA